MVDLLHILRGQQGIKLAALSSLTLLLAACTQTNPAVIKDAVPDNQSISSQDINTDPYVTPPKEIGSSGNTTTNQVVTTTQERIVYQRNYEDIPKGGYQGDYYTVKRGDTLFYIAWITGNDYRALALKNNIKEPYDLRVGQVINVSGEPTTVVVTEQTANVKPVTQPTTINPITTPLGNTKPITIKPAPGTQNGTYTSTSVANISWQWPARGKLIERYSSASKGIDISGALGDKITAAAAGKVVYAGNALPGYGNLIIIKHNDDYLTAYAHNQSILVKEQQDVRAGQQIATMGNTGASTVRLHFEIRYKAKSVDPLKYLPRN